MQDPLESYEEASKKLKKAKKRLDPVVWPYINNPIGAALVPWVTAFIDFCGTFRGSPEEREEKRRLNYITRFAFFGATIGTGIGTAFCVPGGLMQYIADYDKFSDLMKQDFSECGFDKNDFWDMFKQQQFWDDVLIVFVCMLFISAVTVIPRLLSAHLGNVIAHWTENSKGEDKMKWGARKFATAQGIFGDSYRHLDYCWAWVMKQWKEAQYAWWEEDHSSILQDDTAKKKLDGRSSKTVEVRKVWVDGIGFVEKGSHRPVYKSCEKSLTTVEEDGNAFHDDDPSFAGCEELEATNDGARLDVPTYGK